MAMKSLEMAGGESVYCFNEGQLKIAYDLVKNNPESAGRIKPMLEKLEMDFTRNEQAALAFVIIDKLLQNNTD